MNCGEVYCRNESHSRWKSRHLRRILRFNFIQQKRSQTCVVKTLIPLFSANFSFIHISITKTIHFTMLLQSKYKHLRKTDFTSHATAIKAGTFVCHSSVHLQICCIADKLGGIPLFVISIERKS